MRAAIRNHIASTAAKRKPKKRSDGITRTLSVYDCGINANGVSDAEMLTS